MKATLLFIVSATIFFSCKKDILNKKCLQNCKTYNIKGRFYDGTTNEGFVNTPVNLKWDYFRYCIFCPSSKDVYSGKADATGDFNFTVDLDTSLFNDYSLQLTTPKFNNYFELFPRDILKSDLQQNAMINVAYYPIANLELHLHRTQTDIIKNLNILHVWKATVSGETITSYDYTGQTPQIIGDTILNIKAPASISTKIYITKSLSNGNRVEITDSLVCVKNTNNIFHMNF